MFDGLASVAALLYIWLTVIGLVMLCGLLFGLRQDLHMLQLSSYQQQGFYRTLRAKPGLIALFVALCSLAAYLVLPGRAVDAYLFLLASAVTIILFLPGKAKKKFVVTARVKRLICILALLFALTLAVTIPLSLSRMPEDFPVWIGVFTALGVWLALHPFFVSLAALLALPIERAIQRWYIRDAQRMINEHPGLRIIGITGSFGKTSVKHYLTTLLSEKYDVLMTPGSFNTPMGVVRTIREQLRPTHQIFVCEMGARHVGDIKEICDIVHPHDGILTAIGDQHLETFHTRENIVRTKFELLDAVSEHPSDTYGAPLMFINGDDEDITGHNPYRAVTYGLSAGNTYRGEILSVGPEGTTIRVTRAGSEPETLTMPLVGRHNVINVLGAVAVASELGVPFAKCRMAARRLKPAEHRLEIKRAPYGVVLDDAYNSNPAGAAAALEALSAMDAEMVKILVTPGMVELGAKQGAYNADFGQQAAEVCDYILTVGKTNSEAIASGALAAGFSEEKLFACANLAEAMEQMMAVEPGRPRAVLLENDLPDDYA